MSVNLHSISADKITACYLSPDDLNAAASVLYAAYHDDAVLSVIFDQAREGFESRLRQALKQELTAFWDSQQIILGLYYESRLLAVACLCLPDAGFTPAGLWNWRLQMMLTAGLAGTRQFVDKETQLFSALPDPSCHMISLIAVHPEYQHQGLGHILVGAIETVVSESETSNGAAVFVTLPAYQSLFQDCGFSVLKSLQVVGVTGRLLFKIRPGA